MVVRYIKNKLIPVMLMLIIVLIVIASLFSMNGILASGIGLVKEYPMEKSRMFYVSREDELLIYPWDYYNPMSCSQVNATENDLMLLEEGFSYLEKEYTPEKKLDIWGYELDAHSQIIYYKDKAYTGVSGKDYVLNAAVKDNALLYFHCAEVNKPELPLELADSVSAQITIWLSAEELHSGVENTENADKLKPSLTERSNPLVNFLYSYYKYRDNARHALLYDWKFSTLVHQGEILVVFEQSAPYVIFYDPISVNVSGFCTKL